ncbi:MULTISPECIES: hypothetical protein [Acinetobacter calcoaceticus/baumannii complex]|uniref:hypothetical protein n=1 Tax=Acinetobacter calcoaceticus/baumannii complex TaxID=909768 RepID=UPI00148E7B4E|nr:MULTISPECIES: hypothetical protein [Acinetobacter calcoaceticus/baumannii complex]
MYTIRYVHRNNTYYIASNNEGNFIILESLDSEFRMGHQISYDGEKVFNLTLNDETDAVIKLQSNEKGAYEYLHSVK